MNIYIVRHAESENNIDGKFYTYTDGALTEKGRLQAEYCRDELKNIKFDKVYSSHLLRAIRTAEIVGRTDHVLQLEELGEMHGGDYEAKTWEELHGIYPYFHLRMLDNLHNMDLPNGESYQDVKERLQNFINNELIKGKCEENKNILIVSHGITLRILINMLMNKTDEYVGGIYWADNTAITHIEWFDTPILHRLLSNEHLISRGMDRSGYEEWAGKEDVTFEYQGGSHE